MKARGWIGFFVLGAITLGLVGCGSAGSAATTSVESTTASGDAASDTAGDTASDTTGDTAGDTAAAADATAPQADSAEAADESASVPEPSADPNVPELPDRGPNPGLVDIDAWINAGDITSLDDLQGQVVALQFWTFACRNCKATLPHVQELEAKYGDQDFTIVGVHSPEFDYEADPTNIEEAIAELGVTWPVALDTAKRNFHDWQEGRRAFWPRIYLLDRDGHIRYDHIGEGRYDEIDAAVGALLAES